MIFFFQITYNFFDRQYFTKMMIIFQTRENILYIEFDNTNFGTVKEAVINADVTSS